MQFQIRNGFDMPLEGALGSKHITDIEPGRVGLFGADYGDLRPSLPVQEGDTIRAGQMVFNDRRHPEIQVTAPVSGTIREIRLGARRQLDFLTIDSNAAPPVEFERISESKLTELSGEIVRERLLESGLWVAFRARPYERIARPHIEPRAIFVTAVDTNPLAPNPVMTISANAKNFRQGVAAIARLTAGSVYVCGAGHEFSLPNLANVSQVAFKGPHPAGLPGTHIHALERVSDVPDLWHIGYQDVIAIGHLFTKGTVQSRRVISVGGTTPLPSQLISVHIGSELAGLVPPKLKSDVRVVSGSVFSGHSSPRYLGRYHNQVTLLPFKRKRTGVLAKMAAAVKRGNTGLDRALSCAMNGRPGGMLGLEDFERVWPYRSPPVPLLRALLTGDTDTALELGCRGLAEEDLALCTYTCVGKYDYGLALRRMLGAIEQQGL